SRYSSPSSIPASDWLTSASTRAGSMPVRSKNSASVTARSAICILPTLRAQYGRVQSRAEDAVRQAPQIPRRHGMRPLAAKVFGRGCLGCGARELWCSFPRRQGWIAPERCGLVEQKCDRFEALSEQPLGAHVTDERLRALGIMTR